MNKLREYAISLGVSWDIELENKFERYMLELLEWNNKFNLTSITERDKIISIHFMDSISAISLIPLNSTVLDIGSGAGFPAIPIKLVRDDLKIVMIDSSLKKVGFQNHIIEILGLENISTIHTRAEDYARGEGRAQFDIVVSRAVAKLNTLLEYTVPFVRVGGSVIAYKSINTEDEISGAKKAFSELKAEVTEIVRPDFDKDIERALILIKKIGKTPRNYPREQNLPRKNAII